MPRALSLALRHVPPLPPLPAIEGCRRFGPWTRGTERAWAYSSLFVPVIQTHGLTAVYRVCRNDKRLKSVAGAAYRSVGVPSPKPNRIRLSFVVNLLRSCYKPGLDWRCADEPAACGRKVFPD